jgi:hypothetical protein
VARVLSTAFLVGLLAATAAAFALTEGAKLELSPIYKTYLTPVFSPGVTTGYFRFRLRKPDHLTVWMTHDGKRVATIVSGRRYPAGWVRLAFTGVSADGITLPDGVYVPVVHLRATHRTITIPSQIRIDTKPATIRIRHRQHAVISPDGDGHKDFFRVHYAVSERARGILLVDGKIFERTHDEKLSGEFVWRGKIDGRPAKPGNHELLISAVDPAGNVTTPFPFAIVQIRYITLGRTRILVRPGARFALRVSHDSPTVSWILHGRHGTGRGVTLHLRAPAKPGVYRLYVIAATHSAKALVVVA